MDLLNSFFRYLAHLFRRHPGRACTAACSRARAAGVVAEACLNCQNVGEPAYLFQNIKRSDPKAVRQIATASSSVCASHGSCETILGNCDVEYIK